MRLLLGTRALLWWVLDSDGLSRKARLAIGDLENQVIVSAATAWEITTKFRLGRLPEATTFVQSFQRALLKLAFEELPISVEHGRRAGMLPGDHKDPFDRMLIAQALSEGLVLVSNKAVFDTYDVRRLW